MIILQLSTLAFSDDGSSCVDNYLDFEEQTFGNNSENRVKLYEVFYPPNYHLPFSVVVTYQAVLPNGTRVNITTNPCWPDRQVWLWVSSLILIVFDPTTLNRVAFYTLHHFTEWVPPHLTIATPLPCSAKVEQFLTLMTTSVSNTMNLQCVFSCAHERRLPVRSVWLTVCCSSSLQLQANALGEMSKGEHMGYSHQGCATSIGIVFLKGAGLEVAGVYYIIRIIGVIGFVFIIIFNVMASFALLQVLLKALSQKMEASNYSFDSYGMFWGMSAILCPTLIVLLCADIRHICCTADVNAQRSAGNVRYIWLFVLAFPMIVCAPVAIYFGVKFSLPTPSVYLLPAKLLCCCSEKCARALVLSLTFWFDLVAANFLVCHAVFVVYAFLVAPFTVAVNVMLLVLGLMCLTYSMALVFTVCASVGSRRCLRSSADCASTVRAAMLIPLLLAVICCSVLLAFSSNFVNTATQQNNFPMLLKSLITPVLLGVVSLGLKRFILVWMRGSLGGVRDFNDPPGHGSNGYQVLDNDNVVQ